MSTDSWGMRVVVRPLLYLSMLSIVTSSLYHVSTTVAFSSEMAKAKAKYPADMLDFSSKLLGLCLFAATHFVLKAPDYKQHALNAILRTPADIIGPCGLAIAIHRACTTLAGPNFAHVSEVWIVDCFWYVVWVIALAGAAKRVYFGWTGIARAVELVPDDVAQRAREEETARQHRGSPHHRQVSAALRLTRYLLTSLRRVTSATVYSSSSNATRSTERTTAPYVCASCSQSMTATANTAVTISCGSGCAAIPSV